MSFKEIKELRKSGKLQEAMQMAIRALEADPENIWNKRAAAWVYYDYLKLTASAEKFDAFLSHLEKLLELNLPEDEKMVFDNSSYQIGKMVFSLENGDNTDIAKINSIFKIIRNFHFTTPSENYSFLLKAFQKAYKNHTNFLGFVDWWNFDNLLLEDFQPEEFNERKLMSLAEKTYATYAKQLLVAKTIDGRPTWLSDKQKEKIREFLPKLSQLIENHPEYQYPPFYKAKLLLALGNEKNALSAFIPFARQKKNDFWVWDLMAGIFPKEDERQFACYCKALSLKTREDYLVKLRQKFAAILISKELYDEAKTEIKKLMETKAENGWTVSSVVTQWTETEWFKRAQSFNNNSRLYDRHKRLAEEILFTDIPEEMVVVEFVNHDKKIISFVKNKRKHGFFKYSGILKKPQIGDLLKIRFNGDGRDGYYKVLTAKPAQPTDTSNALRNFEGIFNLIPKQSFGFVEDVFIDPGTINKFKLEDAIPVQGKAILSFNKKKNEWGWKAFEIN